MNISYDFNSNNAAIMKASSALIGAILVLSGCASTSSGPKTKITKEVEDCYIMTKETEIIERDEKKNQEEQILEHIIDVEHVKDCADLSALVDIVWIEFQRSKHGVPEDPYVFLGVLLGIASGSPLVEEFLDRALEKYELTEGMLWESVNKYFKHTAEKLINHSVANMTNSDGSLKERETVFLEQSYNGLKSGEGEAFQHVPLNDIQKIIDAALTSRNPPLSIDDVRTANEEFKRGLRRDCEAHTDPANPRRVIFCPNGGAQILNPQYVSFGPALSSMSGPNIM